MPFVLFVRNQQAVIERIEQLMGFIGRDHQRRRKEQRSLFAAGSDDGTRLQCTQRHAGSDGILKGIGAPANPVHAARAESVEQSRRGPNLIKSEFARLMPILIAAAEK